MKKVLTAVTFVVAAVTSLTVLGGCSENLKETGNSIVSSAKDYLKPFEKTHLTQSFENYMRQQKFVTENPSFALGGPSFQWVSESIKAMEKLSEAAEKVKVPVLLVQAEYDTVVDNNAQNIVAANLENCRKTLIAKGFHELLNEKPEFFEETVKEISDFIDF